MLTDLRLAFRSLLKSPGYTAVALATLALGIGVNTSMFSVVDALLFRSAPFPKANRLVEVMATTQNGESRPFSYIELQEIRERQPAFESLTTVGNTAFALAEPGQPAERIAGSLVSNDFFNTFGMSPTVGRAFSPEEFLQGQNNVVLLSHAFWMERFGGARDAIGRTLRLDGELVTIIGVMPAAFDYRLLWGRAALWRPLNFTAEQVEWRDYRMFQLMGRPAGKGAPERVEAELASVLATQAQLFPESYSAVRYSVVPLHKALVDRLGKQLSWMLLGLSAFVLLIACANLANLQLARATVAMRDLAIRAALGASRWRLVYLQLLESLVLAVLGGGVGIAVAFGMNRLIAQNLAIAGMAGGLDVQIDWPILLLALGVSVLAGLLFGLAPALLASRTDVNSALKQQARGSTPGGHHRLRQALIVGEVALALVLLAGAGMLHRGFGRILERHTGWDAERLITAALPVPGSRKEYETDPQRRVLFRKLEERLSAIPGVEHAALTTSLPIFSYTGDRQILKDGQAPGEANLPTAFHVMISSGYFATVGIPLLEGRLFEPEMKETGPRVIVINQALAKRLWPGESALGKRIGSMDSGKPYWAEVIGVVRDVADAGNLREPSTPFQVYKPLVNEPWGYVNLALRAAAPASLAQELRRAVADVDPDLAPAYVATVPQMVESQQGNLRLAGKMLSLFAAVGLLLAAIGLYGVISNLVAQRTGEFGIRLALGARPGQVMSLVLWEGLLLAGVGSLLGVLGAWWLGKALGSMVPRMGGVDPLVLLGVTVVLLLTAAAACWVPARRATKVDPLVALRAE